MNLYADNLPNGKYPSSTGEAPEGMAALAAGKTAQPETVAGAVAANGAGSILFNANMVAGDYVMIGATKFVAGVDFAIGGTTALSVAALVAALTASTDPTSDTATYTVDANTSKVDVTPVATGALGNGVPELAAKCATPATVVQITGGSSVPALSIRKAVHKLTVNAAGNQNFTLPDGDEGQRKFLMLLTKGGAGSAVVTPAHFDGTHTTITFTAINQMIELMFVNGKWFVLTNVGTTLT